MTPRAKPRRSARTMPAAAVALSFGCALSACGAAELPAASDLVAPSAMAVAGRAWDRVLVANAARTTLQVVGLAPTLGDIDLVAGPARFHAALLKAGGSPTHLAASPDGRLVWALDAVGNTLRLLDAENLAWVADAAGAPLCVPTGPSDSEPSALAVAAAPCAAPGPNARCLGRVLVALRGRGEVAAVDLIEDATGRSLRARVPIAVGGAPAALAVHPAAPVAFVSDAVAGATGEADGGAPGAPLGLTQLSFDAAFAATGTAHYATGAAAGAVAMSADGTVLALARPAARDLLLFCGSTAAGLAGPLAPLPAAVAASAPPACAADDAQACADAAARLEKAAAAAPPAEGSVNLGAVPAHLAAVASAAHPVTLTTDAGPVAYREALAIAGLDGALYTLGLRQADGALAPRLALAEGAPNQGRVPARQGLVGGAGGLPGALVLAPATQAWAPRVLMSYPGRDAIYIAAPADAGASRVLGRGDG